METLDPMDPDFDNDIFVSQSAVNNMDLCPARRKYQRDEGYNHTPSEKMAFGSGLHAMTESDIRNGSPQFWHVGTVYEAWKKALATPYDKHSVGYDLDLMPQKKVTESVTEMLMAMTSWQRDVYPLLNLEGGDLAIEERMHAPLGEVQEDGRMVWLTGAPDLVNVTSLDVIDWKTSGRDWKDGKPEATGQVPAYLHLAAYTYELQVEDMKFTFWIFNRKTGVWQLRETYRTQQQVQAWLLHAYNRGVQIAEGIYPATPWNDNDWKKVKRGWWCSAAYCGAWDICEYKFLADNVDEGVQVNWVDGWK